MTEPHASLVKLYRLSELLLVFVNVIKGVDLDLFSILLLIKANSTYHGSWFSQRQSAPERRSELHK